MKGSKENNPWRVPGVWQMKSAILNFNLKKQLGESRREQKISAETKEI
jgi:hypothetical protein